MPTYDYAARTYVSQQVRTAKKACDYFNRYHGILVTALAVLVTGPELAAIINGYAAFEAACQILKAIPDPPPE